MKRKCVCPKKRNRKNPREYLEIGSSPGDESCAQVGQENYRQQAMAELRAYINQLRRMFGEEPEGAQFAIKSFPHDFGTYHEVVIYYDRNSADFAYDVESKLPARWDDEARQELAQYLFGPKKNPCHKRKKIRRNRRNPILDKEIAKILQALTFLSYYHDMSEFVDRSIMEAIKEQKLWNETDGITGLGMKFMESYK